jgi:hypothetical protein
MLKVVLDRRSDENAPMVGTMSTAPSGFCHGVADCFGESLQQLRDAQTATRVDFHLVYRA